MAYKSFDSAVDEMLANRPRFAMGGKEWVCRPNLATKTLIKLASSAEGAKQTDDYLELIKDFFRIALVRKQR